MIKGCARLLLVLASCSFLVLSAAHALAEKLPQRVLYIGHRAAEFEPLLQEHFASVASVAREQFQPSAASQAGVVLLDWPQSDMARQARLGNSPLGQREHWSKPTVLLGSAGLNLAVAWKIKGGSG